MMRASSSFDGRGFEDYSSYGDIRRTAFSIVLVEDEIG